MHRGGDLVVYYAPLEWVNATAKLVLVDATPWKAQADFALTEANHALLEGAPVPEVLRRANLAAAFARVTRERVVTLLDHIGVHQWLGLSSSADLFGEASDLVQMTSVLQYPVFNNGENFRGGWHPERPDASPADEGPLRKDGQSHARSGLYPGGRERIERRRVADQGRILSKERVLHGLPHPRKEKAECTTYFLGERDRTDLDKGTNPDKLDAVRDYLRNAVAALK
ncbi:hypothetical protein bAD24_I10840 [Burkholderia sp. AD24]|nr:hypothetical protein bAD24_I10840 [Burkholderia sp. AD24]